MHGPIILSHVIVAHHGDIGMPTSRDEWTAHMHKCVGKLNHANAKFCVFECTKDNRPCIINVRFDKKSCRNTNVDCADRTDRAH